MCNCNNKATIDMTTPRNVHLSAFYKRSFAYRTVKDRMPAIINRTVEALLQNQQQLVAEYGDEVVDRLKVCVLELQALKTEILSNNSLRNINFDKPDAKVYNDYIAQQAQNETQTTFFHTIWLLSECYMYRRIYEALELASLSKVDPFRTSKEESFHTSLSSINSLALHVEKLLQPTIPADRSNFTELLKLNLWGNKCDLSIMWGKAKNEGESLMDIDALEPFILCNHSKEIWAVITDQSSKSNVLDIILDNSGYEVFADLCLADFMVTKKIVQQVRLYVKTIPWFVSDCLRKDLYWMIMQLIDSQNETLTELGTRWGQYIEGGIWEIVESDFWTTPLDYSHMSEINPELYKKLSEARLIIFKGDLNYRKLFGEKNWTPTTSLEEALNGFHPAPLCTIRTLKSEILCGIPKTTNVDEIDAKDQDWMSKGSYGVIQFCGKVVLLE